MIVVQPYCYFGCTYRRKVIIFLNECFPCAPRYAYESPAKRERLSVSCGA